MTHDVDVVIKVLDGTMCGLCGDNPARISHIIHLRFPSKGVQRVSDCIPCYGASQVKRIFDNLDQASRIGSYNDYRRALSDGIVDLQKLAVDIS